MKKKLLHLTAAAAALAFCLCCSGCFEIEGETRNYTVALSQSSEVVYSSTVEMLEAIRPAVVDVTCYSDSAVSAGSGVIIGGAAEGNFSDWEGGSSAAYDQYFIITNHHVIEGGNSFEVDVLSIAADGTESTTLYDAVLVGSSFKRDIAILSIRPSAGTQLSVASFISDSDTVKVGTEVYAIGNPLGILGGTVTHGIVSATKRAVSVDEIGTMTLMQTDAAINGGNSGGGLFDRSGRLVGIINSGYDSYNGQSVEGLNFAIPANDAKFAAKSLIETHAETDNEVTTYGYVEGDARVDVAYATATLYTSSTGRTRGTYLVAAATSSASPLYSAWGNYEKAIVSVTVNGERTEFTGQNAGSYELTDLADEVFGRIRAGDSVEIVYRDVMASTMGGGFGGFGGTTYNYLGDTTRTASFTAQQYIYQPGR